MRTFGRKIFSLLCLGISVATLGGLGCGTTPGFSVGGSVTGLSGTLVLQNNGGDNVTMTGSGAFAFGTGLANGATYSVTVLTQPSGQNCTVTNGTGTIQDANVSNILVSCGFTVGGSVSGLEDASWSIVLQNNAGDNLTVSANGSFTFSTGMEDGEDYSVTVLSTSPEFVECAITNGTGTIDGASVENVEVECLGSL